MHRATKACLPCKTKKRRCDASLPSCSSCVQHQMRCTYPDSLKRRGPGKTKKKLEAMEDRLAKMESLLRESVVSTETISRAIGDEESNALPTRPAVEVREDGTPNPSFKPWDALLDLAAHSQKTRGAKITPGTSQTTSVELEPAFTGLVLEALPEILQEIPVVDHKDFTRCAVRFGLNTRSPRTADTPFFVVYNSAIAITLLAKLANSSFCDMAQLAWGAFKRAYELLPQLLLSTLDLHVVQATTLMAYYIGFTADAKLKSFLLSNAIRSCELLRVSPNGQLFSMSSVADTRKIALALFIMDTELSLHNDLMLSQPAQSLTDIDLSNPELATDLSLAETIFRKRFELSLFLSTIKEALYPQPGRHPSRANLNEQVPCLDAQLKEWRLSFPDNVWGETSTVLAGDFEDMSGMMLMLTFYNALSMVHWPAWETSRSRGVGETGDRTAYSLPLSLSTQCRTSSREMLVLLQWRAPVQFPYFWRTISFGLSAALTLLAFIIEEPEDRLDTGDQKALYLFSRRIAAEDKTGDYDLSHLVTACRRISDIAEKAIALRKTHESDIDVTDIQALREAFGSVTHPMFVAQDMLTNLRTRDVHQSQIIGRVLGISFEGSDGYSSLVPDCVKSESFLKDWP